MSAIYGNELSNDDILRHKHFRWKTFCLDLDLLTSEPLHAHKLDIEWQDVEFLKSERHKIEPKQGVYMFSLDIRQRLDLHTTSRYVLYVGQAIDLQERFMHYFNYVTSSNPSHFLKRCMVLLWKEKLRFHYFYTGSLSKEELTQTEFDFIDAVVPPMNNRFRGEVLKNHLKLYSPR